MDRYFNKIQINRELHVNFNSYFYNSVVSENFKNYYIDHRLQALLGEDSYHYYIKLRELVLMSIYRFKRIFSFKSNEAVINVQDTMRDYIIQYYNDRNQHVEGTVNNNFKEIILNGDNETFAYSVREVVDLMMNTVYDEITFITSDGEKFTYLKMTLIDAVALRLSDIMFIWNDQTDASFKNYIHHYKDYYLKGSAINTLNVDPDYDYKIIDVLNNLSEYSFNSSKHSLFLENITNIPKKEDSDQYSRIYYDIYDIVTDNVSDEIREIMQTGYSILNFNLISKTDKRPLLLIKILDDIPNLQVNTSIKYTVTQNDSSLRIYTGDSCDTEIPIKFESRSKKKLLNPLPSLKTTVKRLKVDYLNLLKTTLQKTIPQEYYQENTSVFNDIIDNTVVNPISDIINTVSFESTITIDDVVNYLDNYQSSGLFKDVESVISNTVTKLNNSSNDIAKNFSDSVKNNLNISLELPINIVEIFKKCAVKRVYYFESQLKYYTKYLEYGYYGLNFNKSYPEFVNMFFTILDPILTIDNQNSSLTGIIQEIKEYLYDYFTEILVGFYFEYLSEFNLFAGEYVTTPTFTNYSYKTPSKMDLSITTLIGNKSLIYPTQSIALIQTQLSETRILNLSSYKMLSFINLTDSDVKIDFIQGKFNTHNPDVYYQLSKLSYDYDFTVNETKLNGFSSDLTFYPDYIYQNDGIILYNFSEFLMDGYGKGYYFSYNLSQYLTKPILDKITSQLSNYSDYSKEILVSNNIKPEYIVYLTYDVNEFVRVDKYIARLKVLDIIRSLTYDYILSISHNFIFTDLVTPIRTKILEYISEYKSLDDLKVLDFIDETGRDFYDLSYNYRIYLSFESIIDNNITQDILEYNIINTYNISELLKNLQETDFQVTPIFKNILGL